MIERSIFSAINTSAQGLSVQRTRMNVVAENLANVDTTRTEDGGPFRRKLVQVAQGNGEQQVKDVFQPNRLEMRQTNDAHKPAVPFRSSVEVPTKGVHVRTIVEDPSEFRLVHDPAHPDADIDGFVRMPNINVVQEMMELITATRAFEANITAINSSKEMIRAALRI